MKKLREIFCIALLCTLAAGIIAPAQAEATVVAPLPLDRGSTTIQLTSLVAYQGRMLAYGREALYTFDPATQTLQKLVDVTHPDQQDQTTPAAHILLGQGDALYGLNLQTGALYPLTLTDTNLTFGKPTQLDLKFLTSNEGEQSFTMTPEQVLLQEDKLYLVYRDFSAKIPGIHLVALDIKTGAKQVFKSINTCRLAPYKDGKLIALVIDEQNAWDDAAQQMKSPSICIFDPARDTLTEIAKTSQPYRADAAAIAYDGSDGSIYYLAPNRIFRRSADGKDELAAYLTTTSFWGIINGQMLLVQPSTLAVATNDTVEQHKADTAAVSKEALSIVNGYVEDAHKQAVRMMDGIPVVFYDKQFWDSAQKLGQALASGEDQIDIFFLDASFIDTKMLMEKGFCYDLSASPALKQYADALYPFLRETGTKDGHLFMLPVSVSGMTMSYYPNNFSQTDLTPPATFEEFTRLISAWTSQEAEKHPDMIPVQENDYRRMLFMQALDLYLNYSAYQKKEIQFNDPLFRKLAQLAENARVDSLQVNVDWQSPEASKQMDEIYAKKGLFVINDGLDPANITRGQLNMEWATVPLPLAVAPGEAPIVRLETRVIAVNPKSKHLEAAVRYVENYVASIDAKNKMMMMPGRNEPVPNDNYSVELQQLKESEAAAAKAYEKAQGAEKTEMEKNLNYLRTMLSQGEEKMKILVSAQAIAQYRKLLERAVVNSYSMTILSGEEMNKLVDRYLAGQMSLDQFINEADGKLRLMRLENQ